MSFLMYEKNEIYSVGFFPKVKHKFKVKTTLNWLSFCLLDPKP